jgi:transposase, IS5 family
MYEKKNPDELEFKNFYQPFGGKMDSHNRWIKMAGMIPWNVLEGKYASQFKAIGRRAKKVQMAIGALIIQQRFGFSDEETVAQIIENPYLQYFIGLTEYQGRKPIDSSMMVYFRKRVTPEMLEEVNKILFSDKKDKTDEPENDNNGKEPKNKGKLIVDATCVPVDIKYPTDLNLLNEAREKLEGMIDICYEGKEKPRTYRRVARKNYLTAAKNKKLSKKGRERAIRKQLNYVKRDLGYLEKIDINSMIEIDWKGLETIRILYKQQKEMFEKDVHSVAHRIVSISQPHIRPIVRGKAGADVEFGAKVSISLVNGYAFTDRIDWENYNEGTILQEQIENYRRRFGYYPKAVIADKIYRTRANQKYCKERGIRLSRPPLGRPRIDEKERLKQKKQERKDISIRNAVEGEFGIGKRKYGLGLLMTKLPQIGEFVIVLNFLLMNLEKKLRLLLCQIFIWIFFGKFSGLSQA